MCPGIKQIIIITTYKSLKRYWTKRNQDKKQRLCKGTNTHSQKFYVWHTKCL